MATNSSTQIATSGEHKLRNGLLVFVVVFAPTAVLLLMALTRH
jgi:hypothetical protein